jgi:hypothetical protein
MHLAIDNTVRKTTTTAFCDAIRSLPSKVKLGLHLDRDPQNDRSELFLSDRFSRADHYFPRIVHRVQQHCHFRRPRPMLRGPRSNQRHKLIRRSFSFPHIGIRKELGIPLQYSGRARATAERPREAAFEGGGRRLVPRYYSRVARVSCRWRTDGARAIPPYSKRRAVEPSEPGQQNQMKAFRERKDIHA